ncbi:MAG: hypothetical protein V8R91_01435 [Butyricimonas faecihominis]
MEKLPPVQKTVILLRDYEAYSYGEDCRDHGVEPIAGEAVPLSGESIYESLHPQAGCSCLSGRRYDNERELRDLFHGVHGWNLSAREQAEVEAFLPVHPDLWELLDGMDEAPACGGSRGSFR